MSENSNCNYKTKNILSLATSTCIMKPFGFILFSPLTFRISNQLNTDSWICYILKLHSLYLEGTEMLKCLMMPFLSKVYYIGKVNEA